jgi:NodT family efflux transporter outer membrane factor (OMF) lipoprotein
MLKSDACRLALPGTVTALALSACAVGPNYRPPAAPAVDGYTAEQLPPQTASTATPGGEAQHFELGRDLPGEWWTLFRAPQVTALVSQAMASYPDIAAQQAALREARENMWAAAGAFLPQFQGSGSANRSALNYTTILPGLPTVYSNSFQAAVNVSYTFDVWGKQRRTVEGLQAQAVQQSFELEASYLTLTANVVLGTIQVASTREQIAATHEIIDIEEKQLAVAKRRFELGIRTQSDVLQQQSSLDSVRATLPPLQQQLAAAEHSLAVLTGQLPKNAAPITLTLSDLTLPQDLPVSLPSSLVEQRPDIRAQTAALQAANAQIGIATANLLPQLTLTGSFGDQALTAAKLINPASNAWSLTGGITQPLFEGGTLRARRRAAVAAYEQSVAQYRLVVLHAFQNVADTLTALHNDAQALEAQRDSLEAARAGLELIQKQYQIGTTDYVGLLTAQQNYQQARLAVVRGTAARYTDTVTLFQALGGGWWNRSDPGVLPHVTRLSTDSK